MKLSRHFTLAELTTTSRANFRQAQAEAATAPVTLGSLGALARTLLDPIRDHVGGPVRVNSGLRCPALNAATPGASKTSLATRAGCSTAALAAIKAPSD